MRGNSTTSPPSPGVTTYTIVTTPMVQLTIRLSMSIEEFYGVNIVNNIATLLRVRAAPSSSSCDAVTGVPVIDTPETVAAQCKFLAYCAY